MLWTRGNTNSRGKGRSDQHHKTSTGEVSPVFVELTVVQAQLPRQETFASLLGS